MNHTLRKILIIGIRATGKSTLTRALESSLKIPALYTDQLWWGDNWKLQDEQKVKEKIEEMLCQDAWIIEGYIEPLGKERIEQADLVIYLDFSPWCVLYRGIKRYIQHRNAPRLELAVGCIERFSWEDFLILIFRKERVEIEQVLSHSK